MQFSTLLATAFALAIAEAKIAFTQVPGASVTVGKPFTIEWDGAQPDSSVTITLKQGDPNDLTTVALLTGNASGNSFTWTPSSSLPDGDDYALEISQGTGFDTTNYSGEFSITGGSSSASASASASATDGGSGSGSSPSSATITMTSGNSTFVTSYSMYPAATGTGAASTTGRNGTFTHTTKAAASTGGIVVTATSTVAEATTAGQTSPAASSSGAAAHAAPLSGAAAALLGLAALL